LFFESLVPFKYSGKFKTSFINYPDLFINRFSKLLFLAKLIEKGLPVITKTVSLGQNSIAGNSADYS
jgi:hypothetical protein